MERGVDDMMRGAVKLGIEIFLFFQPCRQRNCISASSPDTGAPMRDCGAVFPEERTPLHQRLT